MLSSLSEIFYDTERIHISCGQRWIHNYIVNVCLLNEGLIVVRVFDIKRYNSFGGQNFWNTVRTTKKMLMKGEQSNAVALSLTPPSSQLWEDMAAGIIPLLYCHLWCPCCPLPNPTLPSSLFRSDPGPRVDVKAISCFNYRSTQTKLAIRDL